MGNSDNVNQSINYSTVIIIRESSILHQDCVGSMKSLKLDKNKLNLKKEKYFIGKP